MPLRVTVELIPGGNEAETRTLGILIIERIGDVFVKDSLECGNYHADVMLPGWKVSRNTVENVPRSARIFLFLSGLLKAVYQGKENE